MKTLTRTALILASFSVAAAAFAQQAEQTATAGVLGRTSLQVSGAITEPEHNSKTGVGADIGFRLPVSGNFDVCLDYVYARQCASSYFETFDLRNRSNAVDVSTVGYTRIAGIKPFAEAGLGYAWEENRLTVKNRVIGGDWLGVQTLRDGYTTWHLDVGAEVPLASVVLTPRISYRDGFQNNKGAEFRYSVEAHTWVTKSLGLFAGISLTDPKTTHTNFWIGNVNYATRVWGYSIGSRYLF